MSVLKQKIYIFHCFEIKALYKPPDEWTGGPNGLASVSLWLAVTNNYK